LSSVLHSTGFAGGHYRKVRIFNGTRSSSMI
jgi:hypothetical protein